MAGALIAGTDFKFPGQTNLYRGKVRDVYTIAQKYIVSVATDRVSAFDVVLPRQIPHKGQVLNQLAARFLQKTAAVAPNWLIAVPDPNVSIGHNCRPFKIEMVVRAALVGHAWREYKDGKRKLCGVNMSSGLKEYDKFPEPIITPATKAEAGHDEDITPSEIVKRKLANRRQFDDMADLSLKLFNKGQQMALRRGLFLADTKYEFGSLNNQIYVIDEVHTPDSSRYFYKKSYEDYIDGKSKECPRHLSKEFVREWLMARGFYGQKDQTIPKLTDEFVAEVSARYRELYAQLTGRAFKPAPARGMVEKRIQKAVLQALEKLQ